MNNNNQKRHPEKGSSWLRQGRWSGSGHAYFLTTRTRDQQSIFKDSASCEIIFNSIQWLEDNDKWDLFCVMIMPDHVHLVAALKGINTLEQLMHSWKRYSSREINKLWNREGALWQEGYYDHCIRKEESLRQIILYCYYNPVRKGLVEKPSEYPYWRCKFNLE
ncbi:MAG: transposase [PVC group bacterium]